MNSSMAAYGYFMTANTVSPLIFSSIFLGNTLMAMSSQVMGQIIEKEEDKKMIRTYKRPLPSNLISLTKAKNINIALWLLANSCMFIGDVALLSIGLSNITYLSYYAYLKMKPITKLNTLFGAIVGSLPLLVGIVNNINIFDLGTKEICDLSYLFFWQFLHFYGIVVMYKNDYDKTNFKMESDYRKLFVFFMIAAIAMGTISYVKLNQGVNSGLLDICKILFVVFHILFCKYIIKFFKHPTIDSGRLIKKFSYTLFFTYLILSPIIIKQCEMKDIKKKNRYLYFGQDKDTNIKT